MEAKMEVKMDSKKESKQSGDEEKSLPQIEFDHSYPNYVAYLRGSGLTKLHHMLQGTKDLVKKRESKGLARRGRVRSKRVQHSTKHFSNDEKSLPDNVPTNNQSEGPMPKPGSTETEGAEKSGENVELTSDDLGLKPEDLAFELRMAHDTPDGNFERACFWIRKHIASRDWFENLILTMILVNCVVLALGNPLYNDDHWVNVLTSYTDPIFLSFFILEMILKFLSFGFLRQTLTADQYPKLTEDYYKTGTGYFIDGWNYIDFVVVLFGVLGAIPSIPNVSAIRVIRVLRPLRAVKRIPEMRILVSVLLLSVIAIARVALILSLFFVIFGIAGVSLFMGVLRQRCYDDATGEAHEDDRVCAIDSPGLYQCPDGFTCKADGPNPFFGVVSFDNFPDALLQVFQTITMATWSELLYPLMDSVSPYVFIYFFILILVISFFALNLMLAAIEDTFSDESEKAEEEQKVHERKEQLEKRQQKRQLAVKLTAEKKKNRRMSATEQSLAHFMNASEQHFSSEREREEEMFKLQILDEASRQLRSWLFKEKEERTSEYHKWLQKEKLPFPPEEFRELNEVDREWLEVEGMEEEDVPMSFFPLCNKKAVIMLHDAEDEFFELPGMGTLPEKVKNGCFFHEKFLREERKMRENMDAKEEKEKSDMKRKCDRQTERACEVERAEWLQKFVSRKAKNNGDLEEAWGKEKKRVLRNAKAVMEQYQYAALVTSYLEDKPAFVRGCFIASQSTWFRIIIMSVIMLNTGALSYNHYGISEDDQRITSNINEACAYIFLVELIIKVIGLGPWGYIMDKWNAFDAVVVVASFIPNADQVSGLRTLRLLRIFKLFNNVPELRKLLVIVIDCLSQVGYLVLLVLIFLFMFSILGVQLFAGSLRSLEPEPRWKFDDLWASCLVIFMCVTGDSWPDVMWDITGQTSRASPLFFVLLIVLGDFMIMNLFIAILLVQFDNDEKVKHSIVSDVALKDLLECKSVVEIMKDQTEELKRIENIEERDDEIKKIQYDFYVEEQRERHHVREVPIFQRVFTGIGDQMASVRKKSIISTIRGGPEDQSRQSSSRGSRKGEGSPKEIELAPISKPGSNPVEVNVINERDDEKSSNNSPAGAGVKSPSILKSSMRNGRNGNKDSPATAPAANRQVSFSVGNRQSGEGGGASPSTKENRPSLTRSPSLFDEGGLPLVSDRYNRALGTSFGMEIDHPCRALLFKLVDMRWFKNSVSFLILVNCIVLAIENPHDEDQNVIFYATDLLFTVLFFIEMILKIIAFGLGPRNLPFCGPPVPSPSASHEEKERYAIDRTYLGDPFNQIDAFVVVVSVLSFFPGLDFLKIFRALRPLRLLIRQRNTKVILMAASYAVPAVLNIGLFLLVFFVVFGILCVDAFKGRFYFCDFGELENPPTVQNKQECLDAGFEWVNPQENYDNMYEAILTLFQVATLSGWNIIMYYSIDAVGVDQQPRVDHQPAWGLMYFFFIFLCAFFAMNLFIAVLIDKFNKLHEQFNGSAFLTNAQRRWSKFYKIAAATKLSAAIPISTHPVRKYFQERIGQPAEQDFVFEMFILACISLNAVVIATQHYEQPYELTVFIVVMNAIFNAIFALEAALKLVAWTPHVYFQDGWNIFDFTIVIISFVSYPIDSLGNVSALRLFRLARLFRMFAKIPALRALFETLILSSSSLFNVGSLIFVIFYIYAILGVFLFGRVAWSDGGLSQHANFSTFPAAIITLWRMATGDAWEEIQWGCQIQESSGYCSNSDGNCGTEWAPIYTISFMIFVSLVMVNLFIAVILEGFAESGEDDQEFVGHLQGWKTAWNKLDPQATGILPAEDVIRMVQTTPKPIGLGLPHSAKAMTQILYHFRTSLPLKVYNIQVRVQNCRTPDGKRDKFKSPYVPVKKEEQTCEDRWMNVAQEQSAVHPAEMQKGRIVRVWVCEYTATLQTIARAMFDDFSEEDAQTLKNEHGLTENEVTISHDVKTDKLREWYAVGVIQKSWARRRNLFESKKKKKRRSPIMRSKPKNKLQQRPDHRTGKSTPVGEDELLDRNSEKKSSERNHNIHNAPSSSSAARNEAAQISRPNVEKTPQKRAPQRIDSSVGSGDSKGNEKTPSRPRLLPAIKGSRPPTISTALNRNAAPRPSPGVITPKNNTFSMTPDKKRRQQSPPPSGKGPHESPSPLVRFSSNASFSVKDSTDSAVVATASSPKKARDSDAED